MDRRHSIAENTFMSEFVMSNRDEKSPPEERAAKKRVYFQVPENWDDLSDEEQEEIADQIIDAIVKG